MFPLRVPAPAEAAELVFLDVIVDCDAGGSKLTEHRVEVGHRCDRIPCNYAEVSTASCALGTAASCPQAASMSRPRVRRTVAGMRARSSTALKLSIAGREEPSKRPVGLYGMSMTVYLARSGRTTVGGWCASVAGMMLL